MCDICKDRELTKLLGKAMPEGVELNYCPVCGSRVAGNLWLEDMKEYLNCELKRMVQENILKQYQKNDTTVLDEDGEVMRFERVPSTKNNEPPKPVRMCTVDLDKTNIDKEMAMLEALRSKENSTGDKE